ncbi:MAG: WG repeat-containing protein [Prevotella sp.]
MKKILILLLAVGSFVYVKAQNKPHLIAATKVYNIDRLPDISYQMGDFKEGLVLVQDDASKHCAVFNDKGEPLTNFGIPMVTSMRGIPAFDNGVIPAIITGQGAPLHLILNGKGEKVAQLKDIRALATQYVDGMLTAFKAVAVTKYQKKVVLRYYDKTGKEIFPQLWQDVTNTYSTLKNARPFCNDLSCFYDYRQKKYGYFNRQGKIIIPARYVAAHDFSEGMAAVSLDGRSWMFIDTEGKTCFNCVYNSLEPDDFHESYAIIYNNIHEAYFINTQGKIVSGSLYEASRFFGGYAWVTVLNNGTNSFVIDKNFKTVRQLKNLASHNKLLYDYSDNTIQVGEDIHTADGTRIFTDNNAIVKTFSNGLAPFKMDNACGYLNKKGEIIFMLRQTK